MIKRIAGILLSICVVVAMMPAMAFGETETYDVWVKGIQITDDNKDNVLGDGKVSFTPAIGTEVAKLTLNGANIDYTKSAGSILENGIESEIGLEIILTGENTINVSNDDGENMCGIYVRNAYNTDNLTLSGTGSLKITTGDVDNEKYAYGIRVFGALVVDSGTIEALGGEGHKSAGIRVSGDITVNGGTIIATGSDATKFSRGISANGNITVNDGIIKASGKKQGSEGSCGIKCEGNVSIKHGTVEADGEVKAFDVDDTGTINLTEYSNPTVKVNINQNAANADNWDNNTALTTYKYVKITHSLFEDIVLDDLVYGFTTSTGKPILMTNKGSSNLQIKSVSVKDTDRFEIINPSEVVTIAGNDGTSSAYKIKAKKDSFPIAGVYITTITVTDSKDKTYSGYATVTINRKQLNATITMDNWVYSETESEPTISGLDGLNGSDYMLNYQKKNTFEFYEETPQNCGTYIVYLMPSTQGFLKYEFSANDEFEITQKTVTPTITDINNQKYTGLEIKPTITVTTTDSTQLVENRDYTVEYKSNINVGSAAKAKLVKVAGSNYTWTNDVVKEFEIEKATPTITFSNLTQSVRNVTAPTVTITPAASEDKVTIEYKAEDADDDAYTGELPNAVGTYTVKVSVAGDTNLNDKSETATFKITPAYSGGGGYQPAPQKPEIKADEVGGLLN